MESREAEPANKSQGPSSDRLMQTLVWVAGLLAMVALALAADSCLNPQTEGEGTYAGEQIVATDQVMARTFPTATASPVPITPPPCVAPQDWGIHTVQEGNTLYSLGEQYGIDIESLKRVNCLDSHMIYIGQDLYVPGGRRPTAVAVDATPLPTPDLENQPEPTVRVEDSFPERFVNIILLGSDKRQNSSTWRTDTMILLSVDTESDIVRLLSIPRDLWVNIPGHGYDRINTADLWGELAQEGGGPDLIKQTIYQNLGIPIHYYVRVDFAGFMKIIDAMGGLYIDVECPLSDIELTPGMHHMDGEDALLYARSRITTNDFDRSRRQRKLLMAMWEQGLSKDMILRIPALWRAMADTFQTDIPLDQVISLGYVGLRLKPNRIFSQSIGPWQVQNWITPQGAAVLVPIDEEIQKLLDSFYSPPDLAFLERIGQTRVEVLNGSVREDAAQMAATSLRWAGYQVAGYGNADSHSYPETQVIAYIPDADLVETAAMMLDLPRASIQYQQDPSSQVDILIVLGQDYDPCAQ